MKDIQEQYTVMGTAKCKCHRILLLFTRPNKNEGRVKKTIRSCLPAFSEAGADVSLLQAVDGEVPKSLRWNWFSCGLFG